MRTATFFIATARSGTQWLASGLSRYYGDALVVGHEPIGYDYSPKTYLRADDRLDELRRRPNVARHLDEIHRVLETQSYVEVGFPCFALAPLLWREFGERLRLVQLVRHPVHVAASLVTHGWYQNVRDDSLDRDIELTPSDAGVLQKHYRLRWGSMTPYEKGLFYWTEVHLFAHEARARLRTVPFHFVRFEDVVTGGAALSELASFLGIPFRDSWAEFAGTQVDRYRHHTRQDIDVALVSRHLDSLVLAERYGYHFDCVDVAAIRSRYEIRPPSLLSRVKRRVLRLANEVRRSATSTPMSSFLPSVTAAISTAIS